MANEIAEAYSVTGGAWQEGPGRIYDRLAEVVVGSLPVAPDRCRALDLGAGTGAATRALLSAGAGAVVAVDAAHGILAHAAGRRPPAAVADALALPFPDGAFDVTVASFSLNHLTDPAAGLREAARITRPGGGLVVSAYAVDDDHPVKRAVQDVLAARGWLPEPWYRALQVDAVPKLATPDAALAAAVAAGLDPAVENRRVPFPDLGPGDLVAWRLGMAQYARFVAGLSPSERAAVAAAALAGPSVPWPPLVRSIVILRAVRS